MIVHTCTLKQNAMQTQTVEAGEVTAVVDTALTLIWKLARIVSLEFLRRCPDAMALRSVA